eukprot:Gb_05848 [translate_table: standard]
MEFSSCNEIASQTTSPFGNHNMPDLGQSSMPCGTPVQNVENNVNVESSNRGEQWSCQRRSMDGEFCFRGRYNRGKRTSVEEKGFTTSSEREWLDSRMEKVRIDDDENTPPKAEGSNQSKQFTFAAFSFDGCLVKTPIKRVGAGAWAKLLKMPKRLEQLNTRNANAKLKMPKTIWIDGTLEMQMQTLNTKCQ